MQKPTITSFIVRLIITSFVVIPAILPFFDPLFDRHTLLFLFDRNPRVHFLFVLVEGSLMYLAISIFLLVLITESILFGTLQISNLVN